MFFFKTGLIRLIKKHFKNYSIFWFCTLYLPRFGLRRLRVDFTVAWEHN